MSIHKVAIHAVWGTKNREPFLSDSIRLEVCKHIFSNAKKKDIWIDVIDGYTDHLHCLFYLNPNIALKTHLQLIKGESSKWISDTFSQLRDFSWADEYYAASVSISAIEKVRAYIKNQNDHHKNNTFEDECKILFNAIKNYQPPG